MIGLLWEGVQKPGRNPGFYTTFSQGSDPPIFFYFTLNLSDMENATIFVSYARADGDFALQLATDLRNAGASIWIDQLDIPVGKHWDREVQKVLKASGSVLIILTPESAASENVNDEISYALDEGKPVIPVLFRKCDLPLRLRRLQHANFTGEYEVGFQQLVRSLNLPKLTTVTNEQPEKIAVPKPIVTSDEHGKAVVAALTVIKERNTPTKKPQIALPPAGTIKPVKAAKEKPVAPGSEEALNLLAFDQVTMAEWDKPNKTIQSKLLHGILTVHERTLEFKTMDGKGSYVFQNIHSFKYLPAIEYPGLVDNFLLVKYSTDRANSRQKEVLFSRFAFFADKPTLAMHNQIKDLVSTKKFKLSK
jgi:hypothetical protein